MKEAEVRSTKVKLTTTTDPSERNFYKQNYHQNLHDIGVFRIVIAEVEAMIKEEEEEEGGSTVDVKNPPETGLEDKISVATPQQVQNINKKKYN